MIIYQGDQYAIPFKIRIKGTVITPENSDDVRIQIEDTLYQASDETLQFNSEKNTWEVFLTEEMTRAFIDGGIVYQVGVKMGDVIRHGAKRRLKIDDNIIRAEWSDA